MATGMLIIISMVMIIYVLMYSQSVQCMDIHIKASSNDQCLDSPCLTLSQFSTASYFHNESYINLIFEAGTHRLNSELRITQITSLSMIANTTGTSNSSVTIACKGGMFAFTGVYTIFMKGLNFVHCSDNKVESVDYFAMVDSKFIGQKIRRRFRSLIKITRHTSAHFIRTSFEQSGFGTKIQFFTGTAFPRNVRVGGAIYAEESKIELLECLFEKNKAGLGGAVFIRKNSEIIVNRTSFIKNTASYHGSIEVSVPEILHGLAGGGALFADNSSMLIANSSFVYNEGEDGGAVRFSAYYDGIVTIIGSNFTGNVAYDSGGAIYCNTANTTILITNCSFVNNRVLSLAGGNGGALKLASAFNTLITINGNYFNNSTSNKSGGAISISASNFHTPTIIMSYNYFVNNHASE